MGKAQSSLEYLFMIAAAVVVVALVLNSLSGTVEDVPKPSEAIISYVEYDPPGNDLEGDGEYVAIKIPG